MILYTMTSLIIRCWMHGQGEYVMPLMSLSRVRPRTPRMRGTLFFVWKWAREMFPGDPIFAYDERVRRGVETNTRAHTTFYPGSSHGECINP
jgi:hypothetical protein